MIYNMHDIARRAAALICKEVSADKNAHFTNTSYGERGTILGSYTSEYDDIETEVVYSLCRDYSTLAVQLIKFTRTTQYAKQDKAGTTIREYSYKKSEEVIDTFWTLTGGRSYGSDAKFTDDKALAETAAAVRTQRWTEQAAAESHAKISRRYKDRPVVDPVRRADYEKLILFRTGRKLKKDAKLFTHLSDSNSDHKLKVVVCYEYRNQGYVFTK